MRLRSTVVVAAILAAGSLPAVTATAADSVCLSDPVIGPGIFGEDILPSLTTKSEPVTLAVWGATLAGCPDTAVTARTPGGGLITVPMNQDLTENPPDYPHRLAGTLTLPLGYGAGTWQLTKITSGTSSTTLHHPFEVRRGGVVTLNVPAPVNAPASVSVSGQVRHYTSTGALAPSSGTKVTVYKPGRDDLAYLTTNPSGQFGGAIAMPAGSTGIIAEATDAGYWYDESDTVDAVVNQAPQPAIQVVRLLRSSTAYVNEWWRLDGTVNPGRLWTDLEIQNGPGWKSLGSFGYSAADANFTRWWKPTRTGTYQLRIELGQAGVQPNGPQYRQFSVTVKSKQAVPTYLEGTVAATNGGAVYRGTTMSSYGHLKDRYSNGHIGAFAGQRIAIQVSSAHNAWRTIATSGPTTSTGYFSVHWPMPFTEPTTVRYVYTSPYITIKSALLNLGVVDVK
jgi:hypothetical protein